MSVQEVVSGLLGVNTKSKVQDAVNNLLGEVHKRNQKIQEKVNRLQQEATLVKSDIGRFMRLLVESELSEDTQGLASLEKRIAQLRITHDDLMARLGAYQDTMNDPVVTGEKVAKVLDLARKEKDRFHEARVNQLNKRARLQQDIEKIKIEISSVDMEISRLEPNTIERQLAPIVKYIEPRVQPGSEARYIHLILNGSDESQLRHCLQVDHKVEPMVNATPMGPSYEERELERERERQPIESVCIGNVGDLM